MSTTPVEPLDVAQYFLARAELAGEPITILKLQKLVYYAYGHTLGCTGRELFTEKIEAWPYGPVVRSVYEHYVDYGASPLTVADQPQLKDIPPEVAVILDAVCNRYMPMNPWNLMQRTHEEKPWRMAYREGQKLPLSDDHVKEQFYVEPANLQPLTDADMLAPGDSLDIDGESVDGPSLMEELLGRAV